MASSHGCISDYVLVYPKHLPACFQLFLDGETICVGNNPYCPVPSRNIAASQSPTKSAFILSTAVPQTSPVAGFCTLCFTACYSPSQFPATLTDVQVLCPGWPGELLPLLTVLARRAGLPPGEMECRHASNSLVLVPTQLSPHKEGTLPH